MKKRNKNVSIDAAMQSVITARMLRDRCSENAAIRSLLLDGGGVPGLHPVVAHFAPQEEREKFAKLLLPWCHDFAQIKSRLGGMRGDPDDEELNAQIDRWRKLADELESRARNLWEMADSLARAVTGFTEAQYAAFRQAKRHVRELVEWHRTQAEAPDQSANRSAHLKRLDMFKSILASLELLGL